MKKKLIDKVLLAVTTLFLLSPAVGGAREIIEDTVPVEMTITGLADGRFTAAVTRFLEEHGQGTDKAAGDKPDEFPAAIAGASPQLDMTQFKKKVLDVPYANTDNPYQQLDIIYPTRGAAPYKVIMAFHGGVWLTGNKQSADAAPVQWATRQGYAVVNVNYRLAGDAKWPAQLYDADAAVRFIRANAAKYNLDDKRIVVWGNSSGGHIAEMLAAANGNAAAAYFSPGKPKISAAVQGVVALCGISDIAAMAPFGAAAAAELVGFDPAKSQLNKFRARVASPIDHITADYPPALLVHGTNDRVVPFVQAVRMAERINAVTGKQQAQLKLFIGATHGCGAINSADSIDKYLDFVDAILYPAGNPYRSGDYSPIKTYHPEQ